MNILVGADPELFVKYGGEFVSAHNMVKGTKEEPFKVGGGAVQVDGMALEFNIDPAASEVEFIDNIKQVMGQLKDMVDGYEVVAEPTAHFGYELIAEQPEEARDLGCDPDYNAYTGEENPPPDNDSELRTCAGHVHLGFEYESDSTSEVYSSVVGYLDWIVGCWTVLNDSDTARRERYGKAGAFRPKPYGLEYRVPSNFWLKSDDLKRTMFNRVRLAYGLAMSNTAKPSDDDIITSINTHDAKACSELLKEYA